MSTETAANLGAQTDQFPLEANLLRYSPGMESLSTVRPGLRPAAKLALACFEVNVSWEFFDGLAPQGQVDFARVYAGLSVEELIEAHRYLSGRVSARSAAIERYRTELGRTDGA